MISFCLSPILKNKINIERKAMKIRNFTRRLKKTHQKIDTGYDVWKLSSNCDQSKYKIIRISKGRVLHRSTRKILNVLKAFKEERQVIIYSHSQVLDILKYWHAIQFHKFFSKYLIHLVDITCMSP